MIDGTYEYLTASFVDWLRLPEVPFVASPATASFVSEDAVKPYHEAFPTGVVYNGLRYIRSRCGKSFDLCDADRFGLYMAAPISVQEMLDETRRVRAF